MTEARGGLSPPLVVWKVYHKQAKYPSTGVSFHVEPVVLRMIVDLLIDGWQLDPPTMFADQFTLHNHLGDLYHFRKQT